MLNFKPLDVVVLTADLPNAGLKCNDVGTIVETSEPAALEVEFVGATGKTIALVTVPAAAVRSPIAGEMLAVRPA